MNVIQSINFGLENCEVIEFQKKHIEIFHIRNISNRFVGYLLAEEIVLKILSMANQPSSIRFGFSEDQLPFERLTRYADITSVGVVYEDGHEEQIYVEWSDKSEYINEYQTSLLDPNTGHLYLVISKKNTALSMFHQN